MNHHMEDSKPDRDSIQESDILAALKRVLDSAEFSRSKRAGAFLHFVVEEKLAGRGDRLKAFSIAREVYGRDETFDPRTDTIVRVEAGRLRSRLAVYYETAGHDDPVRIDVPKGGYAPTFDLNDSVASEAQPETITPSSVSAGSPGRKSLLLSSAILLAIIVVLAGWLFFMKDEPAEPGEDPNQSSRVFLAVLPLATHANDSVENHLAAGLVEAIVTDLVKLSGLSVMAHASLLNLDSQSIDLDSIRRKFGATHALRGSLEREGDLIRINVQLIEIASSTTIWADRLEGNMQDLPILQDALTEHIVNHLAIQVSAEERALFKRHHSSNPEALALYRHALVLLMPPNDMDRIVTARHMFQRVIEIDPEFAGGYAGKGFSHSITVLFLKTEKPDAALEKGINLALKAIEIDPDFGMGYVTLAFAYVMSGRKDEALFNARRAIDVQPGDAFTQFVYGLSLTLSGHPHEAIAPLTEAIRLDPAEPRTPYRNVLGIAHYLNGEYSTAARIFEDNIRHGGPSGPHMDIFLASTYAELGDAKKAESITLDLLKSHPEFPVEGWLAIWLGSSGDQLKIMENLYRLGLPRR
jgi:adenylate cyclase